MKILLIDNYDSFTFNVYHYLSEIGSKVVVYRNDKISPEEIIEMKPKGIVISPGPCTPNEAGISLNLINKCENLFPILGICLGHQSIGQVFGSKIIQAKKLMHGKISKIKSKKIGILKNLPKTFEATRYHSLIIEKKSLSENLKITAETEEGLIMGVQHKVYNIHGVQFHPESIKTKLGIKILKNFVNY